MREFGSEFWEVPTIDNNGVQVPDKVQWFMSGRMALSYIIKDMKLKRPIRKVGIPSWCCDSMIAPFTLNDIEVVFYPVVLNKNKDIIQDYSSAMDCDALLTIDYFGYNNSSHIDFDGYVICDITHSMFSDTNKSGNYVFGSTRKWAGFYTGGFAYCKDGFDLKIINSVDEKYSNLRKQAMNKKRKYICGEINNKDYLTVFSDAEIYLENCFFNGVIATADLRDIALAKQLDIKTIKKQRWSNAQVIHDMLQDITMFKNLESDGCPTFVPIVLPKEKRDALYKHLIENNIYCPIHWPISEYHLLNEETKDIYDSELSIICDQRYDENDITYICSTIRSFLDK